VVVVPSRDGALGVIGVSGKASLTEIENLQKSIRQLLFKNEEEVLWKVILYRPR